MAISSAGYYGTVSDAQWAQLFESLPHWFRPSSFVPTAVSGARSVSLSAGVAFGAGVRDVSDAVITVALTPPSSGGQWFLIVLRRVWSIGVAGTTSVQVLAGPSTSGAVPTAPPSSLPATLQQTPSATDDAPVAWVHVRAADTTLTIFDARIMLGGNGSAVAGSVGALAVLALITPLAPGLQVINLADGITYQWTGTTWQAWDSPWTGVAPIVTGVTGAFGATPGWFFTYADMRYRGGRVLFRWSFTLNGGTTISSGLSISLPVTAHSRTQPAGHVWLVDSSAGNLSYDLAAFASGGAIVLYAFSAGTSYAANVVAGSNPVVAGQGDTVMAEIEYDAA